MSKPAGSVCGNDLSLLRNGEEIFPAMLDAIRGARRTICFETYIYWDGEIAEEFAEALAERAAAGVAVYVLLDWYGCLRMGDGLVGRMRDAGVELRHFRPLRWYQLNRFNHRTHRKLLVVDGRTAFTGGVGIADQWRGDAEDADHWRDNHYRLRGPAVSDIQRAFFLNWQSVGGSCPEAGDRRYYPAVGRAGDCEVEVVSASPARGAEDIHALFLAGVRSARRAIRLASAYFMPGEQLLMALEEAGARGIDVQILVCGPEIDFGVARRASRHHWGRLLKAGVRLFEFEPTLFHVKSMVVDRDWVTVGSANFDSRSCLLNEELNLAVRSEKFARLHRQVFEQDVQRSRPIDFATWRRRPMLTKVMDWSSQLFRRHL